MRYKRVEVEPGKLVFEHRIVWEQAHGPIPPGYIIHHKDGNGKNNSLDNLELMTRREHVKHHSELRRKGVDPVDPTDPDVIKARACRRKWVREHKAYSTEQSRKYRETHREESRAYAKEYNRNYYEKNKEAICKQSKAYYDSHIDQYRKAYHDRHEVFLARYAKYRAERRELLNAKQRLRTAKKKNAPSDVILQLEARVQTEQRLFEEKKKS